MSSSLRSLLSSTLNSPSTAPSLANTLRQRRENLARIFPSPVLLWSGQPQARNFPANVYPFRANSHFLYFAGSSLQNAAICLDAGRLELFMDNPTPASALWHGVEATREEVAEQIGADAAFPLADMAAQPNTATVAVQDHATRSYQARVLKRAVVSAHHADGIDSALIKALVELRLVHDAGAIAEMRHAIAVSIEAHKAGMAATLHATHEAAVRAALESVFMTHDMTCAYSSIVTVHGEVLHNEHYHHPLNHGDLLLVDAGAEATSGWASDITRTWPVSGTFSPTQRDMYDVVLAAHDACIAQMRPGFDYRDIHLLAARTMAEGLVELGILKGNPDSLVDMDAYALFFPHGIGHLLGLDVHDMEDLGDTAGYAEGQTRSDRFGLCYLRLDRPLKAGMVCTIEPGFYQVPAILNDPERRSRYADVVDWDRLAQFSDVRGIRIEDDVLVTDSEPEVLTANLPTEAQAIEQLVNAP
ncbi:MAG: aminopeptidase P family protein [Cyanobacteria bacterium P01_E01_bin.6]